MLPAAESRAPRLNGPKRGPGSHPALCSGLGKEASSSPPRGWVPPGLRCGALFQTRRALLPTPPPPPPALCPRRCGLASLGRHSPWRSCPVPGPGLRQLTGDTLPSLRAEKPLRPPRAPGRWLAAPRGSGIYPGTCWRPRRRAGRPRPRKGWGGRGPGSFLFSPGARERSWKSGREDQMRAPGARISNTRRTRGCSRFPEPGCSVDY